MGIPSESLLFSLRSYVHLSSKESVNVCSSDITLVIGRTPLGKQAVFQILVYSLIIFISPAKSFLKEQCGNTGEIRASMLASCHLRLKLFTKLYLLFRRISNCRGGSLRKALMAIDDLSSFFWKKFLNGFRFFKELIWTVKCGIKVSHSY